MSDAKVLTDADYNLINPTSRNLLKNLNLKEVDQFIVHQDGSVSISFKYNFITMHMNVDGSPPNPLAGNEIDAVRLMRS